jgi:hypothetical protein
VKVGHPQVEVGQQKLTESQVDTEPVQRRAPKSARDEDHTIGMQRMLDRMPPESELADPFAKRFRQDLEDLLAAERAWSQASRTPKPSDSWTCPLFTYDLKAFTGIFVFVKSTDILEQMKLKQEWQTGYYQRDEKDEVIMNGPFPAKWVPGKWPYSPPPKLPPPRFPASRTQAEVRARALNPVAAHSRADRVPTPPPLLLRFPLSFRALASRLPSYLGFDLAQGSWPSSAHQLKFDDAEVQVGRASLESEPDKEELGAATEAANLEAQNVALREELTKRDLEIERLRALLAASGSLAPADK